MFILPSGPQKIRRKGPAFLAFALFFLVFGSPLQAAEFAGGTLTVVRDAETADCPDEAALGAATLALGRPPAERTEPVTVSVVFQRDAFGYGAIITTAGSQAGVREIRKPGPACATVAEAVSVVLAVLFDLAPPEERTVQGTPEPEAPPASAPAPAPLPPPRSEAPARPAPRRERPRPRPRELSFALGAHGAASYGLLGAAPVGAATGALRGGIGRWELGAGALGAPNRAVEHIGRLVYVSVVAGRLVGCGWLFAARRRADVAVCTGVLLGRLRARGEGFDSDAPVVRNAWFALEAGAAGRLPLTSNLALRVGISLIVPSRSQEYTVAGAGTAFQSTPAAGLVEAGPELRFP
jgi:hypothetical protein